MRRNLVLLGATGSIGTSTLDVLRRYPDRFRLVAFSFHRNQSRALEIAREFRPGFVVQTGEGGSPDPWNALGIRYLSGVDGLKEVAGLPEADVVLVATAGTLGVHPTLAALKAGKRVALANKETLVSFGPAVKPWMQQGELLPVDSEHSALFQLLEGRRQEVSSVVLTASGGPFRTWSLEQMRRVRPADALKHPTWNMGAKITVDSATLMNKGLEVIEAHWLFDLPAERIQVVVHPQSIVHALVHLVDGASLAHLGYPDMRIPIQYALTYPERWATPISMLDLARVGQLTFEEPDLGRFPLLRLAYEALEAGGNRPCVLNAANEEAVHAFLREEIGFLEIVRVVQEVLDAVEPSGTTLEELLASDARAREQARQVIRRLAA